MDQAQDMAQGTALDQSQNQHYIPVHQVHQQQHAIFQIQKPPLQQSPKYQISEAEQNKKTQKLSW